VDHQACATEVRNQDVLALEGPAGEVDPMMIVTFLEDRTQDLDHHLVAEGRGHIRTPDRLRALHHQEDEVEAHR
jgi:hypothetical protein